MFVVIGWIANAGQDPAVIEGEILSAVDSLEFTNYFAPFDGLFIANIDKKQTRQQQQLLHNKLLALSSNRFEYMIAATPNAWSLPASRNWRGACTAIANFET